jgi:hypothetical protein
MTPVAGKCPLKALADSPGFFSHIQSPYSTVKKISETSWVSFDSLQESSQGMEVICLASLPIFLLHVRLCLSICMRAHASSSSIAAGNDVQRAFFYCVPRRSLIELPHENGF